MFERRKEEIHLKTDGESSHGNPEGMFIQLQLQLQLDLLHLKHVYLWLPGKRDV